MSSFLKYSFYEDEGMYILIGRRKEFSSLLRTIKRKIGLLGGSLVKEMGSLRCANLRHKLGSKKLDTRSIRRLVSITYLERKISIVAIDSS